MTEEKGSEESKRSAEAWREVGRSFESLGQSLSHAFRTAWEDESTQDAMEEVRAGLQSMARSVADAVDDTMESPEGQKFREEAERFAESAREAGEQAASEARPHIVAAMKTIQDGLASAIQQLERAQKPKSGETASSGPEEL
ncbi:MAG: hypothetical protein ACP5JG_03025 [Anaerolineae bacterium]